MSKKWKIALGAVIAAVVIAGVALAVWGAVTFRNRVHEYGWEPRAHKWGPEATTQLRRPELVEGEVRLVDDDGDGIPDRGVIEVPEDLQYGWGYGPSILRRGSRRTMPFDPSTGLRAGSARGRLRGGPHFGRGFAPHFGRGPVLSLSKGFGPFFIVGGLFRLAFLALLIGLAVAFFRHRNRAKGAREAQQG
jgi:hypothetical protein